MSTVLAGVLIVASLAALGALTYRLVNAPTTEVVAAFGPAEPLQPPSGPSFVTDGFSGDELAPAWKPTNMGSAVVGVVDGSLVIDVPAGSEHEAWGELDRPRVALAVADEDFVVDVTFSKLPTVDGQAVGVSFERTPGEWVSIEIDRRMGLSVQALSTRGALTEIVGAVAVSGSPELITLRIGRADDTWNVWYRPDGRELVEVAAFVRELNISTFAIGAGARADASGTVPGVVATVLEVNNIGSPLDSVGPEVTIDVVGEGSYTADPPLDQLGFGTTLVVRAEPAPGWELTGWTGPGVAEGSSRRVVVDGDLTLGVEFGEVATDTIFDVWYGPDQTFGIYGKSQTWINVLGNVTDPDGLESLTYTLNGGGEQELGIGPDEWRLADPGDFNVELDFDALRSGRNDLEITAVDGLGNATSTSVIVRKVAGDASLRPITIDWADVENVQDVVQITDGHFEIQGDTVGVVSPDRHRLMLVGDESWTDYEVTTVVTPRALDSTVFSPFPGPSNFFVAGGWQGHVDWQGQQPQIGYWPTGALALVLWPPLERMQLTGNEETLEAIGPAAPIRFGVSYNVRFRVETVEDGVDYRFKMWPQDTTEPQEWDVELLETTGPTSGSIGFGTHHLDARFGPITVTPL